MHYYPMFNFGKGAEKNKTKNINDGACFTHTYILKIIFFLGNAENCMPKLLLKKKHHFTFFGFTCIHKTIIDGFFTFPSAPLCFF